MAQTRYFLRDAKTGDILPKRTGETRTIGWNFAEDLASGETIISVSTTAITVHRGTDSSPGSVLAGSAAFSGSTVSQAITAGVSGVTYLLVLIATTSLGNVLHGAGLLFVSDNVQAAA